MIGVIYGGESYEHEVSINSGKAVLGAIDGRDIFIDRDGSWFKDGQKSTIEQCLTGLDVVIPMIHGTTGEDGSIAGLLELYKLLYAGSCVKSSAICMDKDLTKKVLEANNIKTTPSKTFYSIEEAKKETFTFPCIIKASSLGSTVGVYKVDDYPLEYIKKCFSLSSKVLVEEYVEAREIFCSILDDGEKITISDPCEIIHGEEIFSYEKKYFGEEDVSYHFSAKNLDYDLIKKNALNAFNVLQCHSMARVDMFVRENGEVLINEVNTIPGFTKNSLYPMSFIKEGISYKKIIETLVRSARKPKRGQYCQANTSISEVGMLVN